ncbi:MAG: ABC transporter substrate-binding protein [Polyangiaceae bacterium]
MLIQGSSLPSCRTMTGPLRRTHPMNLFQRTLRTVAPFLAIVAFAASALAGEPTDVVKAKQSQVIGMLKAQPDASKERDQKIAAVLLGLFDYETMAKNSLSADEWSKRSDAEKQQFSSLLKQLIQKNLERNLKSTQDYNLEFTGEDVNGDSATVKTKAIKAGSRDEPYAINYTMTKGGSGWRSTDVITEDVSMVDGYRSQFTKIIARDGWDALIKKMKDRLANGG